MVPKIIKKIPLYFFIRDVFNYAVKRAKSGLLQDYQAINFEFQKLVTFSANYPDKTFYIIRNKPKNMANLCAYFYSVLGHIMYADASGYIPVVDMENYLTVYNEKKAIQGTWNAWEYYFKQPNGGEYTLQDAYSAKNIIMSPLERQFVTPPYSSSFYTSDAIALRHNYINKYISFTPQVLEMAEKKGTIFQNKNNILGVMHHNSFEKVMFHPVIPNAKVLLEKTLELYKEWKMEYIFLSTIDSSVVTIFKKVFQDKLLLLDRNRIDTNLVPELERVNADNKNHPMQQSPYTAGLEYLTELILLSRCDTYIGPISQGSFFAIDINNNQYRNRFIFDLGLIKPDNNTIHIGYQKYFTPYPPPFDETICKIIPVSYASSIEAYILKRKNDVLKWIKYNRNNEHKDKK